MQAIYKKKAGIRRLRLSCFLSITRNFVRNSWKNTYLCRMDEITLCAFMAFCFVLIRILKQIYYDMRKQLLCCVWWLFLSSAHMAAQSFRKDEILMQKPELSAEVAYPPPSGKLTPPPAGYVPIYISHYGRHGFRYLYQGKTILDAAGTWASWFGWCPQWG